MFVVEYMTGNALNDSLGSFRFKESNQVQIFNKGYFSDKYGSNFVYTQSRDDVKAF